MNGGFDNHKQKPENVSCRLVCVITEQVFSVDTFCEYDHFQYKGHCYKMVSDNEKSWSDAQKACREDGAKLVSISDSQEQAFLNGSYSQTCWLLQKCNYFFSRVKLAAFLVPKVVNCFDIDLC